MQITREFLAKFKTQTWVSLTTLALRDMLHVADRKQQYSMAYVTPARLFAVTRGRSVLCIAIAPSGQQQAAFSGSEKESIVNDVPVESALTPDSLQSLALHLEVSETRLPQL